MPRQVALLRAVNVGAANRISMEDLKRLFTSLGFSAVSTYIQSGNVLFDSSEKSPTKLRSLIEGALAARMKNDIAVLLRTPAELRRTVRGAPFSPKEGPDAHAFVTFLDHLPRVSPPKSTPNGDLEVVGRLPREIFSVAHPVRGRSGNPNAFLEKALGVRATTRNWNVVQALAQLASL